MKKTITGHVLLPRKKKDREQSLTSIYQTLFVSDEYRREFRARWAPDCHKFKAKLVIEFPPTT